MDESFTDYHIYEINILFKKIIKIYSRKVGFYINNENFENHWELITRKNFLITWKFIISKFAWIFLIFQL